MSSQTKAAGPISGWQPYARHYMHTCGFDDAIRFKGIEFMSWIDARWEEFAAQIGERREKVRSTTHGDAFAAWLASGCPCRGVE